MGGPITPEMIALRYLRIALPVRLRRVSRYAIKEGAIVLKKGLQVLVIGNIAQFVNPIKAWPFVHPTRAFVNARRKNKPL